MLLFDKDLLLASNGCLDSLVLVGGGKREDALLKVDNISHIIDQGLTLTVSSHWDGAVLEFLEHCSLFTQLEGKSCQSCTDISCLLNHFLEFLILPKDCLHIELVSFFDYLHPCF